MPPFVPLGTKIRPYGTIGAVGSIQGERYYWLTSPDGRCVSMMPADVIEPLHRPSPKAKTDDPRHP